MSDIQASISAILERRLQSLPSINSSIEQWAALRGMLESFDDAIQNFAGHAQTPEDVSSSLQDFSTADVRDDIDKAIAQLKTLLRRFSRRTINIGVSGRARVGKSTLLQSISGLGEGQIPTGSGIPVTAVRSRIFHSAHRERSVMTMHSFDTFRDEVLRRYHEELGLSDTPHSLREFKRWAYPESADELPESYRTRVKSISNLQRLNEIQASAWSFEADLTGSETVVELQELRQFIAYPTSEEEADPTHCRRRYLAVRDAEIRCSFPHAEVERLGIVDLPGLGELAPNVEQHHVDGLQNDVDVVVLSSSGPLKVWPIGALRMLPPVIYWIGHAAS